MSRWKTLGLALAALAILAAAPLHMARAAEPQGDKAGLFINLTTDDTWAAGKAFAFAGKVLAAGHKPVAIWLNVRAVYLGDKKRASKIHQMIADFTAKGGKVIMCRLCAKAAGLPEADFVKGVELGNWPLVSSILFDPKVKTLSW